MSSLPLLKISKNAPSTTANSEDAWLNQNSKETFAVAKRKQSLECKLISSRNFLHILFRRKESLQRINSMMINTKKSLFERHDRLNCWWLIWCIAKTCVFVFLFSFISSFFYFSSSSCFSATCISRSAYSATI